MNHEYTPKFLARYWAKIDKNGPVPVHCPELGPCWVWTASTTRYGYGQIYGGKYKVNGTHRVAYEIAFGVISDDICVLHHCDNKRCCNPSHLFLGTRLDNALDRERKGRGNQPKGENHGRCKYSDEQIAEVFRLHNELGIGNRKIAKATGISRGYVLSLLRGQNRIDIMNNSQSG